MATQIENKHRFAGDNGVLGYKTTLPANHALSLNVFRNIPKEYLYRLLELAWEEDPSTAIRVIKQSRDIRGGKGEKTVSIEMMLWLRVNKQKTYKLILKSFIEHGCFKDLLKLAASAWSDKSDLTPELNIFAEYLQLDYEALNSRDLAGDKSTHKFSLAAKWAPTERSHYDHGKQGRIASRLALIIFPESTKPYADYRKMITKLRQHLNIVEKLMCVNKWPLIEYQSVPSRCMTINSKVFARHDPEGFSSFKAASNDKTKEHSKDSNINELVRKASDQNIELLWADKLKKCAPINIVTICDMSDSMAGGPMEASVAVRLVSSLLSKKPWNKHFISFSTEPEWCVVEGNTFTKQVNSIRSAKCGQNLNLEKVFDLILAKTRECGVSADDMPSTLVILSDMQFDEAIEPNFEAVIGDQQALFPKETSVIENAQTKFKKEGHSVPHVVYWNLRPKNVKFEMDMTGVTIVSGLTYELLNVFTSGLPLTPTGLFVHSLKKYSAEIDESEA